MLFSAAPVNSTPFSRNRFCCGRLPETAKLLPVVEFETPMPPVFSEVKFTIAGIERHQQVEAASVERQRLDFLLAHQTSHVLHIWRHQLRIALNPDLLAYFSHPHRQVGHRILSYGQSHTTAHLFGKTTLAHSHFVTAHGECKELIASGRAGFVFPGEPGFGVSQHYVRTGDRSAGLVHHASCECGRL